MAGYRLEPGPLPLLNGGQLTDHLLETAKRTGRLGFPQPARRDQWGHVVHAGSSTLTGQNGTAGRPARALCQLSTGIRSRV